MYINGHREDYNFGSESLFCFVYFIASVIQLIVLTSKQTKCQMENLNVFVFVLKASLDVAAQTSCYCQDINC